MTAARALDPSLIKAVQAARRRAGIDEPVYRDMLSAFGVVSTRDLTRDQAGQLLDRINGDGGAGAHAARSAVAPENRSAARTVTGRYAGKLRALWLTLYNLGVARNRDDAALIAFVERQTGLSHPRFLLDGEDAARAIEALKAIAARDGGVRWPTGSVSAGAFVVPLIRLQKIAVLEAQWQRLIVLGAVTVSRRIGAPGADLVAYAAAVIRGTPSALATLADPNITDADLDRVQAALGTKIRKAMATGEHRP